VRRRDSSNCVARDIRLQAAMRDSLGMPQLRLVVGPPAALEDALLAEIATLRAHAPLAPLDVLVGGVLQRPYFQRRAATEHGAILNVRFSTLGELGVRLGEAGLIAAARTPLPAIAERGFAAEIARGAGGYFTPVAETPGFAEAARRLVRELRQEAIDPDLFAALAPSAAESAEKAEALVDLYTRYVSRRADRYDGEDALAAADPDRFDGTALLAIGVWRLGAHARAAVEALAQRVPVTFFLPSFAEDVDAATGPLTSWLEEHGAVAVRLDSPVPASALGHVQANLYRPRAQIEPDASVCLVSAPDPLTESREAARTCLDWARAGIPFREMAVGYREAELYRPLVEAVFAESGIPVYLDDGPSVAERPLGRRVLGLLELIDSALVRRDVMAFLSDGWLPDATRERYGGAPIGAWESASRRAGVVQGIEQWRERLGGLMRRERAEAEAENAPEWLADRVGAAESLLRFVEDLDSRLSSHPDQGTWAECLAALRPLLLDYVDDVDAVVGHLDQLAQLDELLIEPVAFDRFLDAVRAEIQALKAGDLESVSQGAFGLRGVSVLDVNQLRHLRFDAVVVLGLTERSFPPPPRQDPLLLDEERQALNAAGSLTLPLRARGPDLEPMQFGLAVGAARTRLLLSTRRASEPGGRPQLPSSFFRLAASALAGRRLDAAEIPGLDRSLYKHLPAGRLGADSPKRALTLAERDITVLEQDQPLGAAVLHRTAPETLRADALRRARWGDRTLTPFDGVLSDGEAIDAIEAWLAESYPLSPTVLEAYAGCPYRFFLGRLLRVRPIEDPEEIVQLSALDRGAAIHEILEQFLAAHTPSDLVGQPRAVLLEALQQVSRRVLDDLHDRGRGGAPLMWQRSRTEIEDDLVRWLDNEISAPGSFTERGFEVGFGGRWDTQSESPYSRDEPLVLPVDGHALRLRGRIDRLEWEPGKRFRVLDYKSGRNRQKGVFEGGKALQLAMYMLAAADIVGIDLEHGSASYEFVTRRGGFTSHTLTGIDLTAARATFDGVLSRIVGGVRNGDFHAEPEKWACKYCDFDSLCDAARLRQADRKRDDPRRISFTEMKGVE
jgi:ATP-dependent helicase/nuclease subunit B